MDGWAGDDGGDGGQKMDFCLEEYTVIKFFYMYTINDEIIMTLESTHRPYILIRSTIME